MTVWDNPPAKEIAWCRSLFECLKEGGAWGVPRSGMIFRRRGNGMVLTNTIPHMPEMPITEAELREQQGKEYQAIKQHFEAAGIPVDNEASNQEE